jgi:hypothetical protein
MLLRSGKKLQTAQTAPAQPTSRTIEIVHNIYDMDVGMSYTDDFHYPKLDWEMAAGTCRDRLSNSSTAFKLALVTDKFIIMYHCFRYAAFLLVHLLFDGDLKGVRYRFYDPNNIETRIYQSFNAWHMHYVFAAINRPRTDIVEAIQSVAEFLQYSCPGHQNIELHESRSISHSVAAATAHVIIEHTQEGTYCLKMIARFMTRHDFREVV